MVLLVTGKDFDGLLSRQDMLSITEDSYREWASGRAYNLPRITLQAGLSRLRMHSGALPEMGVMGVRVHAPVTNVSYSKPTGVKANLLLLWSTKTQELEAIVAGEGYKLESAAALSAVACKYLAREDAASMGVFGSGMLARDHVLFFKLVRDIKRVRIYSRSQSRRNEFANFVKSLGLDAAAEDSPERVLHNADIVVCATDSDKPVFSGGFLEPGTHVTTSVAPNLGEAEARHLDESPREIDDETVRRSDIIVTNSVEQVKLDNQGSLSIPLKRGIIAADKIHGLSELFLGGTGRKSERDISLFVHAGGQGVSAVAIAYQMYDRARKLGRGIEVTY